MCVYIYTYIHLFCLLFIYLQASLFLEVGSGTRINSGVSPCAVRGLELLWCSSEDLLCMVSGLDLSF